MEDPKEHREEEELVRKIIQNINENFGRNINNLCQAKERVEQLTQSQKELEKKLLFATSEAPDKISKAIKTAEKTLAEVEEIENRRITLNKEVSEILSIKELQSVLQNIAPHLKIIEEARKVKMYQKWLSSIQDLSSQVESCLKLSHEDQALMHYGKLKESAEAIVNSQCINLKNYTFMMVLHWHKILLNRLEKEFQAVLKALKWPFTESKPPTPSQEAIYRLETIIGYLLRLEIPDAIKNGVQDSELSKPREVDSDDKLVPSFLSNFKVSSTPLQLLLKPLELRFLYHFSGEKATNSRRNPEWYLTQILKWITIHESFVVTYIQPVLSKFDCTRVNAKVEFMKGLLHLVVLKLSSDFPQIQEDEDLFCLTLQETLNFEKELRLSLGYPASQPTVLSVLTQASVFSSWIALERKFALELMDEFVAHVSAWECEQEGAVSQCGEQLILLLQGITDRYKPLLQPGHRLQFLDLQLELLDDFRVRLLQLTKSELSDPLQSNYIPILNTVHYLVSTISDWTDLPFFIEMQYFKEKYNPIETTIPNTSTMQPDVGWTPNSSPNLTEPVPVASTQSHNRSASNNESSSSDSVFSTILDLYSRIESEMLSVVNKHVLTEVRARSQAYRRDKWFVSPLDHLSLGNEPSPVPEISPSLCLLLEALVKLLLLLRKKLSPQLFSKLWKDLAAALNKFIYEEVILQNNFSEYGASQLNHDMTKAIFPIFGEFTNKPENYFPLVKDSLILLTLPRPTAFLLRDTILQAEPGRDYFSQTVSPVKALEENGVHQLSVGDAKVILNIRTNMAVL